MDIKKKGWNLLSVSLYVSNMFRIYSWIYHLVIFNILTRTVSELFKKLYLLIYARHIMTLKLSHFSYSSLNGKSCRRQITKKWISWKLKELLKYSFWNIKNSGHDFSSFFSGLTLYLPKEKWAQFPFCDLPLRIQGNLK